MRRIDGVAALATIIAAGAACSESGTDAPPRINGCIDVGCPPTGGPGPIVMADGGATAEGGTILAPADPLEGTTKKAALLKGGFRFTEGPVWIGGRLLFTDIPDNAIYEVLADGTMPRFRRDSGGANGLAVDSAGNLVACEGVAKRVSRSPATKGAMTDTIVETFSGAPLNAPNDVIVRADGNVYFTDPNYSGDPDTQDDEAVYRIDPLGKMTRVNHDFNKPNGIALSPDKATLYVVDNGAGKLLAAPVDGAGGVGTFAELATVQGGDGMGVDDAGNLYVTDDNGVDVFDRGGKKLGTVTVDVKPTNCTFGGADRRTLYITANGPEPAGGRNPKTGLYSIHLNIPGLP